VIDDASQRLETLVVFKPAALAHLVQDVVEGLTEDPVSVELLHHELPLLGTDRLLPP